MGKSNGMSLNYILLNCTLQVSVKSHTPFFKRDLLFFNNFCDIWGFVQRAIT